MRQTRTGKAPEDQLGAKNWRASETALRLPPNLVVVLTPNIVHNCVSHWRLNMFGRGQLTSDKRDSRDQEHDQQ